MTHSESDRVKIRRDGSYVAITAGTQTRLDDNGRGRDTDVCGHRPLAAGALELPRYSSPGQDAAELPSLVLHFAEPAEVCRKGSSAAAAQTETFQKGNGGVRDSDISATRTETKVCNPIARDTDAEQSEYSPIGARRTY